MVEALVQQLTAARAQGAPAAAAPSDLRDKLVQTDHTELSQVRTHNWKHNLPSIETQNPCDTIELFESVAIYYMSDMGRHGPLLRRTK